MVLLSLIFNSMLAGAQYRHFDNFEMQLGFKNHKATPGRFEYEYNNDTVSIGRGVNLGPPDMQVLIGAGMEFEIKNNIYLAVKGEYNLTNERGGGAQLGAGYRLKLNYFMRLQPELLLSWGMLVDTIGVTSPSASPFRINDITFWPNYEIVSFYKTQYYGVQPKLSLVAEFASNWEFRYTMMYQVNFVYNQAVQLRGNISPTQDVRTSVPFRSEFMTTTFDGEPLTKPLYRSSGFTVRAGFAYKFPLNRR